MNAYDFSVKRPDGANAHLSQYQGMVSLIVNTARGCAYASQLPELEALYQKYKDRGFVLLLFPSSQFHGQEPGSDTEVERIYRQSLGITAPVFAKINVNGAVSDRLYRHLVESKRYDRNQIVPEKMEALYREIDSNYQSSSDIKWNFTKFLIGRDGNVIKRFEPEVTPQMMEPDIAAALNQPTAVVV